MTIAVKYLEEVSQPPDDSDQFTAEDWFHLPRIERMRIGEMLHRLTFVGPPAPYALQKRQAAQRTRQRLRYAQNAIIAIGAAGGPWQDSPPVNRRSSAQMDRRDRERAEFIGPPKPYRGRLLQCG